MHLCFEKNNLKSNLTPLPVVCTRRKKIWARQTSEQINRLVLLQIGRVRELTGFVVINS